MYTFCSVVRVGSKHIPGTMIPYPPVTEVHTCCLFVEVLIQMSKYQMSGLHAGIVVASLFPSLDARLSLIVRGRDERGKRAWRRAFNN